MYLAATGSDSGARSKGHFMRSEKGGKNMNGHAMVTGHKKCEFRRIVANDGLRILQVIPELLLVIITRY